MAIDQENAERPLRQLKKLLRDWSSDPSVEEVHALRTHARGVEAVVHAFMLRDDPRTLALLKTIKPVRKAAGKIRDLDVLIAATLTLQTEERNKEALTRLLEDLAEMRSTSARRLHHVVTRRQKEARRGLKRLAKVVGRGFADEAKSNETSLTAKAAAAALDVSTQLIRWPKLSAGNIHAFRIEVRELRNILLLATEPDAKLAEALRDVKDGVGAWHDWQQLYRIAKRVLNKRRDAVTLRLIRGRVDELLRRALAASEALRRHYFPSRRRQGRKLPGPTATTAIMEASSRLAG